MKEPNEEHNHTEFKNKTKRDINTYNQQKCKEQIEELTTDGRNGLSFKLKRTVTKNELLNFKSLKI